MLPVCAPVGAIADVTVPICDPVTDINTERRFAELMFQYSSGYPQISGETWLWDLDDAAEAAFEQHGRDSAEYAQAEAVYRREYAAMVARQQVFNLQGRQ